MKSKKTRNFIWSLVVAGYVIVIGTFLWRIAELYKGYHLMEKQRIENVQSSIREVLNTDEEKAELAKSFDAIVKKYPMELIVYQEEDKVFSTFGDIEVNSVHNIIHKEAVLYKMEGNVEAENSSYQVMCIIYHVNDHIFTDHEFVFFSTLVILLTILICFSFFYMRYSLSSPLGKITRALEQFNDGKALLPPEINERVTVDTAFNRFTQKLENRFELVTRDYTELEMDLQFERERMGLLMTVARAYIHDFKTPVHRTLLENEMLYRSAKDSQKDLKNIAAFNIERNDELLKEINEVLVLMDTGTEDLTTKIEIFDLHEILDETFNIFKASLKARELSFYSEGPEHVFVSMNKVSSRIILHNLFSNAVKHALSGTEVYFEIIEKDTGVILRCQNTALDVDIKRMKNSECLFNVIENTKDYGSGNGLYLLKELCGHVGADYELIITDNIVTIEIKFPKYEMND